MSAEADRLFRLAWSLRRAVRRVLARARLDGADLEDAEQLIMVAAWELIRDGKLVIARRQDERFIMIAWLTRVAENRVRALRREAWKAARHEVFADDFAGEDPVPRLEARKRSGKRRGA